MHSHPIIQLSHSQYITYTILRRNIRLYLRLMMRPQFHESRHDNTRFFFDVDYLIGGEMGDVHFRDEAVDFFDGEATEEGALF